MLMTCAHVDPSPPPPIPSCRALGGRAFLLMCANVPPIPSCRALLPSSKLILSRTHSLSTSLDARF
jgi:hypothetical protein